MSADVRTAFLAYPSAPRDIGFCVRAAAQKANNYRQSVRIKGWEENDISGRLLTDPIFKQIEESPFIVADVTVLNFNVTFEIGYAIGAGKRAFLIRNKALVGDEDIFIKTGIFDTLGYEEYANEDDLAKYLGSLTDWAPRISSAPPNNKAPVYILETPVVSQIMNRIIARVKKARLKYRSFIESEELRLSASKAFDEVVASYGVVIPLLPSTYQGADVHNVRAAFVAGIAQGLKKPTLILQPTDGPVPIDVRDFTKTFRFPEDLDRHVGDFALDVTEALQEVDPDEVHQGGLLANLQFGDPMAENELETLAEYYLSTDEFNRTVRGEVNIVVGRKGAGKTALFAQLRDNKRRHKGSIVVDLKPEGYQLIKLKEQVLDFLSDGSKAHLITAFWEYLLLLEVCHKVLAKDRERHLRDADLYKPYQDLESAYGSSSNVGEADFSERLQTLSQRIIENYQGLFGKHSGTRLNADQVTELVYTHDLRRLRDRLGAYLAHKEDVWVLFDNLDRGWSPHGLARGDIVILRCLIDAARKIQRELRKLDLDFHSVVFIRNDVFELLIEQSADFGKESRATVDWTDPDLLREMLRKRFVRDDFPADTSFEKVWSQLCISHCDGEETSQYFIERSLMRPRNLLKIFGHCRGFAVNLQHARIEEDDIRKGLKSYANDLVTEADRELTDIESAAEGLIYNFVGEGNSFSYADLEVLFEMAGVAKDKFEPIVGFLLYYGFLGFTVAGGDPKYVFDYSYDMRMLTAVIQKAGPNLRYVLNQAFTPALSG